MTPPSGFGRQLTADDWIQAGFTVLAEGGPDALRIGRLCEQLEVTKGSFYWHFSGMQDYRAALAGAWGSLRDERGPRLDDIREADPGKRLAAMMAALVRPEHWALERAMRVWALKDDRVLASVQRSDRRVLCTIRQAFIDYGFDDEEADVRSAMLFAARVGFLYAAEAAPARERVVDFMLRR